MNVTLKPGKYVVAVSGGVDSVVLFNVLSMQSDLEIVVAHFDHGIRQDSSEDAKFVEALANSYGLTFESARGELGPNASEALAREKRYEFLNSIAKKHSATAIITAHHYDDMLETAIINLVRGTNRKGLSSLSSNDQITRPLLNYSKQDILEYAKTKNLEWREDPTNVDEKYLRNRIRSRLKIVSDSDKKSLYKLISSAKQTNKQIDELVGLLFQESFQTQSLDKKLFASFAHDVSCEVLASWLRRNKSEMNSSNIEKLVQKLKTASTGSKHDVDKRWILVVEKNQIRMQPRQ